MMNGEKDVSREELSSDMTQLTKTTTFSTRVTRKCGNKLCIAAEGTLCSLFSYFSYFCVLFSFIFA
jgi:hypothetical protein